MHEFGHNVGIDHGGVRCLASTTTCSTSTGVGGVSSIDYSMNCKPNYASVMSYTRQFPIYLGHESWVGNVAADGRGLDFSREKLATVQEGSLSETTGLTSALTPKQKIIIGTPTSTTKWKVVTTGSQIDWNNNGAVSGTVAADINNLNPAVIPNCGAVAGQTLTGSLDWPNLQYDFKGLVAFQDGFHPVTPEKQAEITGTNLQKMIVESKQFLGLNQPVNSDGSSVYKIGSIIPIKFQIFDSNGNIIRDAKISLSAVKISNDVMGKVRETQVATKASNCVIFSGGLPSDVRPCDQSIRLQLVNQAIDVFPVRANQGNIWNQTQYCNAEPGGKEFVTRASAYSNWFEWCNQSSPLIDTC